MVKLNPRNWVRRSRKDASAKGSKPKVTEAFKEAEKLEDYVDAALDVPTGAVDKYVARLVRKYPEATPEVLIQIVSRKYLKGVSSLSAGVGAGAAYPGLGTVAATGLSAAEVAAFMSQTAWYTLVVSRIHGVAWEDRERRRTLVLSALLGEEGAQVVSSQLGLATVTWAKAQLTNMTGQTMRQVNRYLTKYAGKKIARRFGQNLLGKLIPFGIGAVIGWMGGRAMGHTVVEGVRASLGQAPAAVPGLVAPGTRSGLDN